MSTDKNPILQVNHLNVHFPLETSYLPWKVKNVLKAVDDISFNLYESEVLGIVGESGCGKSSLAKALVGLHSAQAGSIVWKDQNLAQASPHKWKMVRHEIQMIFQDPIASLNPRMTIGESICEPLNNFFPHLSKKEKNRSVKETMDIVGLRPSLINRYPHEFSGGQCQRAGIARALITQPKLIICDEPVSALDVSIQAQIINLLKMLKRERNLSLLFITHDLSVVKHISDRILVMYLGNLMELASSQHLYSNPLHPYTQALLSAIPSPNPHEQKNKTIPLIESNPPSPIHPPSGCVFRTRCPIATHQCSLTRPKIMTNNHHTVACLKVTS